MIRPAYEADLDDLVELENVTFNYSQISKRRFRNYIRSASCWMMVATKRGRIVGNIILKFKGTTAHIETIIGGGYGRKLLAEADFAARDYGSARMTVECKISNFRAAHFYLKAGFKQTGRIPAYYEDGCGCFTFEKTL